MKLGFFPKYVDVGQRSRGSGPKSIMRRFMVGQRGKFGSWDRNTQDLPRLVVFSRVDSQSYTSSNSKSVQGFIMNFRKVLSRFCERSLLDSSSLGDVAYIKVGRNDFLAPRSIKGILGTLLASASI